MRRGAGRAGEGLGAAGLPAVTVSGGLLVVRQCAFVANHGAGALRAARRAWQVLRELMQRAGGVWVMSFGRGTLFWRVRMPTRNSSKLT